jgi:hypothetical protein
MKYRGNPVLLFIVFMSMLLSGTVFSQSYDQIPEPEAYFGFKPGTDRLLFTYEQLIAYLQKVDVAADRISLQEIGASPLGRKMYICFISSESNIANLENLRWINEKLALDDKLTEEERQKLIRDGKVFVLATLSMHAGEVGPSQSAPLIAYDLATTVDPQHLQWLSNVVYMMVPCHNPDGMDMIVEHYNKYKNTKFEGSSLPGVYHKYVGHDNNRDFVILSQEDTKAIAAIYNQTWFPQVMVEKHQMGYTGPRYFVPPTHDPIAENVESGIWNWSGLFGANLIKQMTASGLSGVSQHYLFDDYWPGSTETCIWKNVIGFLTECASAQYARPIYIEPGELQVSGKGLSEYKKSINMPEVWPGGWWRLADIVEYEISSSYSIIETAALYREKILTFRNDLCRREVGRGLSQAPYYFLFPLEQHDGSELVNLVNLLREHGIRVYRLNQQTEITGKLYRQGDIVVPLAQPFRPFIKEVLEKQTYPVRHYTPDGEIIKPYDITTWSLPLHRAVRVVEINERSDLLENNILLIENTFELKQPAPAAYHSVLFTVNHNESFKAAFKALQQNLSVERTRQVIEVSGTSAPPGSFLIGGSSAALQTLLGELSVSPFYLTGKPSVSTSSLKKQRIALVETYFHDMDAGWTRYLFDQYGISYKVIRPGDFKETEFKKEFDLVIFPDADKNILMEGRYKSDDDYYVSDYPPDYTKGIGKEGMENLLTFLESGGLIIAWGRSTALFKGMLELPLKDDEKEAFQLPFEDVSSDLQKQGLFFPGSLVAINVLPGHPLTFGMPQQIGVFFRGRPVFTTSVPDFDMDRRVLATFPETDILLSGYSEKAEKLANKSAMISLKKGKGQLVLFAFNPQFRASTQASYKLLFNALLVTQTGEKRD